MLDTFLMLASGGYNDARDEVAVGLVAFIFFMIFVAFVVALVMYLIVCTLLFLGYNPLPEKYKQMPAWQVFLLLIPLFNLFWNFRVFTAIPDSYRAYFESQGRTDQGDCGRSIGMFVAVSVILSMIPCLNYIASWAALVLIIVFLVKLFNMKSLINSPPPTVVTPPAAQS